MLRSFFRERDARWLFSLVIILILWASQAAAEVKEGPQTFSFRLLLSEKKCQMAIWLTDEQGAFVDTVYVTRKVAKKGLGNRRGGLDDKWGGARLSALPVWAYDRGIDYITSKLIRVLTKTNITNTAGIVANPLSFGEELFR